MFYHVHVLTDQDGWFDGLNLTREQVLDQWVCPFIAREPILRSGILSSLANVQKLIVFGSERAVDSDWPVKKADIPKLYDQKFDHYAYRSALYSKLDSTGSDSTNVTAELTSEAIGLLDSHQWRELLQRKFADEKGRHCFFICPFGNPEVDRNYRLVIKPRIEKYQFQIERVDEIEHSKTITEVILSRIRRAQFVVADLTETRPNCYYEVGYAQALGKPVILLAKEGTERHFDLSAFKWNYWRSVDDLLEVFDRTVDAVIKELGPTRQSDEQ